MFNFKKMPCDSLSIVFHSTCLKTILWELNKYVSWVTQMWIFVVLHVSLALKKYNNTLFLSQIIRY